MSQFSGDDRRSVTNFDAYFNGQFKAVPRPLGPGEVLCSASENDMFVSSVLNGVLVSMHDTELRVGAMTYVLIPPPLLAVFPYFEKAEQKWVDEAMKPIVDCIGEMKRKGAGKNRIQTRLMGGGKAPGDTGQDAGTKNYVFVREYIVRKGLAILNEDLGGECVRRVHFFPATGRAVRLILKRTSDFEAVLNQESKKS